jgi:hypothetical protein
MIDAILIHEMTYRSENSYFRFSDNLWYKPVANGLEIVPNSEWLEELFQNENYG